MSNHLLHHRHSIFNHVTSLRLSRQTRFLDPTVSAPLAKNYQQDQLKNLPHMCNKKTNRSTRNQLQSIISTTSNNVRHKCTNYNNYINYNKYENSTKCTSYKQ